MDELLTPTCYQDLIPYLFPYRYVWSGLIVVLGIYLNVYSKKNKLSFTDLQHRLKQFSARFSRSPSRKFLIEV